MLDQAPSRNQTNCSVEASSIPPTGIIVGFNQSDGCGAGMGAKGNVEYTADNYQLRRILKWPYKPFSIHQERDRSIFNLHTAQPPDSRGKENHEICAVEIATVRHINYCQLAAEGTAIAAEQFPRTEAGAQWHKNP